MGDFKRKYPKLIAFFTYYQMLGGLLGLMITFILLKNPSSDIEYIGEFIAQTVAFCLSFYCGYQFLNKANRAAIDWSIFCHLLQLVQFKIGGFYFLFASGIGFFRTLQGSPTNNTTTLSISKFRLEVAPLDSPDYFSLNLIALLMLILLIILKIAYAKK